MDDQLGFGFPAPKILACLDSEGRLLWSRHDFQLEVVLGDGRLLGVTYEHRLRTIDREGCDASGIRDGDRTVTCGPVASIRTMIDRVAVVTERELLVTDRLLNLVERIALPRKGHAVFVGDGVVYREDDDVVHCDRAGRTRVLCRIPVELAHAAMDRWERATGTPALAGWTMVQTAPGGDLPRAMVEAATDPSKGTQQRRGDRLPRFAWAIGYVESMAAVFLANWALPPHLIMCLGRDGEPRWCTYLSSGCCGGLPTALPDGRLVASSGCGGVVSWLDASGAVLARHKPHDGVGLASACGSEMRALADSGCIVDGSQGVVAYGADCKPRWRSRVGSSCYDYDAPHDRLVTATWQTAEGPDSSKSVTIECIKGLGSPRAMA